MFKEMIRRRMEMEGDPLRDETRERKGFSFRLIFLEFGGVVKRKLIIDGF